jgi:hypothetical protein
MKEEANDDCHRGGLDRLAHIVAFRSEVKLESNTLVLPVFARATCTARMNRALVPVGTLQSIRHFHACQSTRLESAWRWENSHLPSERGQREEIGQLPLWRAIFWKARPPKRL